MRENISTIFAVLFGVVVLIIFPLLSIMSRQDSISYNKVLTLTTEFVDNVRTKGYMTENDYTDYLVNLSSTGNTYKVTLEYHDRILINDINNNTLEPAYVEDTLIYYNKYINEVLEEKGKITFKQDDEFYVKVYNTNITTASLLYNFFARVSIPPKVINIGYGGKVSNTTGDLYEKTNFATNYSPYIKISNVVNAEVDENKSCYDEAAGIYEIEHCIYVFNLHDENDRTLYVDFSLHNFDKIVLANNDGTNRIISISDLASFESNIFDVIEAIEDRAILRGLDVESYTLKVLNDEDNPLRYENKVIKGKIQITAIELPEIIQNRNSAVVIQQGLGIGMTGIVSSEATSNEIILARVILYPATKILGPFIEDEVVNTISTEFEAGKTAYFKIELEDYDSNIEYNVIDLDEDRILERKEYTLECVEIVKNKEYWVKLTYYSLYDKNLALSVTTQKPVDNAVEEDIVAEYTKLSNSFLYNKADWTDLTQTVDINSSDAYNGIYIFTGHIQSKFSSFSTDIFKHNARDTEKFIKDTLQNCNIKLVYVDSNNPGYKLNYTLEYYDYDMKNGIPVALNSDGTKYNDMINGNSLQIYFKLTMNLCSQTQNVYQRGIKVKLQLNNIKNEIKYYKNTLNISLLGLKIPDGFIHEQDEYINYIIDRKTNRKFQWIMTDRLFNNSNNQYMAIANYETYVKMKESMEKNHGYYLSVEPVNIDYKTTASLDDWYGAKLNSKLYWEEAWESSVEMYEENSDIVSHMVYITQIPDNYYGGYINAYPGNYKEMYNGIWLANTSTPSSNSIEYYFMYTHPSTAMSILGYNANKLKYGLSLYYK